jgi:hypothetical protein
MAEKTTQLAVSGIPAIFIEAIDALVIRTHQNKGEIRLSRSAKTGILLEEALVARGAIKKDTKTGEWTSQHQTIYENVSGKELARR